MPSIIRVKSDKGLHKVEMRFGLQPDRGKPTNALPVMPKGIIPYAFSLANPSTCPMAYGCEGTSFFENLQMCFSKNITGYLNCSYLKSLIDGEPINQAPIVSQYDTDGYHRTNEGLAELLGSQSITTNGLFSSHLYSDDEKLRAQLINIINSRQEKEAIRLEQTASRQIEKQQERLNLVEDRLYLEEERLERSTRTGKKHNNR